ncbi:type I-E CRISPR-associated protein Cas6/Cse3/CasE [Myceligenerans pegani]|uniref:Type I-E CRISPR-associated protein Cas6/Cse3/CasE n=1 Tax=Myceligenerans pegani TaxID=2776917 RepID=A0ABR9N2D3_9MICO|nr:type I-E CRISPR-associated protein Cas6/Cse3/CasE [Myceligenerans sp. TRM 65318]MBE1877451.1 type I-E CRISPR-associated protein Cas6/Cse3/CasE [Myceligenerans sp. TRM 65318]MBE3019722.1 type I-E CRISPR-associated protein Cas6/Cse3/CasE [Myceligenerans sp. TRM 65318]
MYLTRSEIDPTRRSARKLLGSPQAMHAAVLGGFDHLGADSGSRGRVLWRVDQTAEALVVYVVSEAEPDLDTPGGLLEQAGRPGTQKTRPYSRVLDQLEPGQRWAFRLRGNPVKSVRDDSSQRGQRVARLGIAGQTEWLTRKAERLGIDVGEPETETFAITRRGVDQFIRATGGRRTVTIAWAQFDGTLEVRDADLLRQALTNGVGPAKGYGCGLLTLAKAPR